MDQKRQPIFVTGLHKSGTTWLANLLANHPSIYSNFEGGFLDHEELLSCPARMLENQPDDESLEHLIAHGVTRWANRPWNHWLAPDKTEGFPDMLVRLATEWIVNRAVSLNKPQATCWVDKTPRTKISAILRVFPEARVIYAMRDPRDRAISLYSHCQRTEPWVIEAADGLRRMHWDELFAGWQHDVMLNQAHFANEACLVVKYEELLVDTAGQLLRILNFLGLECGPERCADLVQAASFEVSSGGRPRGVEDTTSFFRKGVSGDWKNFSLSEKLTAGFNLVKAIAEAHGYY